MGRNRAEVSDLGTTPEPPSLESGAFFGGLVGDFDHSRVDARVDDGRIADRDWDEILFGRTLFRSSVDDLQNHISRKGLLAIRT